MLILSTTSEELTKLCDSNMFQDLEEKYQVQTIQAVPKRKALKLLTEEIRFLPFSPERPTIKWQPSGWHYSTLAKQLQQTELNISRCQKTGKILAYSFETSGEVDKGHRTWVDVYCDSEHTNLGLVLSYLLCHLRNIAVMKNRANVACSFHFPQHVVRDEVKAFMNDVLNLHPDVKGDYHSLLFSANLEAMYNPKHKL